MEAQLARVIPNPFNPQTTIQYELSASGPVRVQVFDLRGRLIATLVDEALPTGRHEVVWAGNDDAGRRVSSGIYVCRIQTGGFTETARMVLLKYGRTEPKRARWPKCWREVSGVGLENLPYSISKILGPHRGNRIGG